LARESTTRNAGAYRGTSVDILSLIRSGAARTRAELIAQTGLSRSTVSQRLSQLFDSNLVVGEGEASSTGGRPATILAFNGSAGIVIAAALGATRSRVAVVDVGGKVLAEHEEAHSIAEGPTATLEGIAAQAEALLKRARVKKADVWGFGVGLPGPVEFASGRPISPPIMPGWDGFPVAEWLEEKFSCTVLVDNDVNVMALGEREHLFAGEDEFMFVKVGTGIGAGIIAGGHLHRGAQGSAGDIGHIYVPGHDDVVCECGNTGCLEAVVGGRALARRLRARGLDTANSRDVVVQVLAGHTDAVLAVREAGRELGLVLAGLVNAVNPAVIVLGGAISAAGDHLLAGVREVIYRRSPPLATRNLRIVASATGGRAGVMGAASMITSHVVLGSTLPNSDSEKIARSA
jgi:predicted NBD/HSP70 family sugar kinase